MITSVISKKEVQKGEAVQLHGVRDSVFDFIKSKYPEVDRDDYLSLTELNTFRREYLADLVEQESGELQLIDRDVMNAVKNNSILFENIQDKIDKKLTVGQRVADSVAQFGGSWTFIISFFVFLLIWMTVNILFLASKAFDPYPFILLNLILSCLAAIQAPIIMMSQNRQEQKDRLRSEHDYKINLKAELEIKLLSEKIDHLIIHQNRKLLEIQEVQADYLDDLTEEISRLGK